METLQKEKGKGKYVGILLFVVLIWGLSPLVSKHLMGVYSPAIKTSFNSLVCVLTMLLISIKKLKLLNKEYFKVALTTGLFYAAACVMQQVGLEKTTPARYAFLENLSCLVVPFLVWLLTKKRPRVLEFVGAGLCLISAFILSGVGFGGNFGVGELLCGLAGIFYGVNIAGTGIKAKKLDGGLYLLVQFTAQWLVSTVYALCFEDIRFSFAPQNLGLTIGITLVSSVLGWSLRTLCLKHLSPTLVAVIMPFSAVVTSLLSVLVGQDSLSSELIIGGVVGLAAALIADFQPKKKQKAAPTEEGPTGETKEAEGAEART